MRWSALRYVRIAAVEPPLPASHPIPQFASAYAHRFPARFGRGYDRAEQVAFGEALVVRLELVYEYEFWFARVRGFRAARERTGVA